MSNPPKKDSHVVELTLVTLASQMSREMEKIITAYLWKWCPDAQGITDSKMLAAYIKEKGGNYSVVDSKRDLDGTTHTIFAYANSRTKEERFADITFKTSRKSPTAEQIMLEVGHVEISKPANIGIKY